MLRVSQICPFEVLLFRRKWYAASDVFPGFALRAQCSSSNYKSSPLSKTAERNFDGSSKGNINLNWNASSYRSSFANKVPPLSIFSKELTQTCLLLRALHFESLGSFCSPLQIRLSSNNTQEKPTESQTPKSKVVNEDEEENLTLFQKFKSMYKKYWYVLIPVHCTTSVVWYGSFFFAAKSGIDLVPYLEMMSVPEKFLYYLRDSNAGYYAIAYGLYKIATPARYTVTLAGTTLSINYMKNRGYIKPVPTKDELKSIYEDQKEKLIDKREEMKEIYQEKKDEFKTYYEDKKDEIIDKYQGIKSKEGSVTPDRDKTKQASKR